MSWSIPFLIVLLGVTLITCKRGGDDTDPVVPETGLKILELHLAGIPDNDIVIDQEKRIITIRMPSTLPSDKIKATVKLSTNARLFDSLHDGYLKASHLYRCHEMRISLKKKEDFSGDLPIQYTVVTIPAGKLTPNPKAPIELELNSPMALVIPAENLYGNVPLVDARVVREGSTEKMSLLEEQSPASCGRFSFSTIANHLQLSTSRQLPPGRYKLELVQADSTVIAVSQPLIVKKGTPYLGANLWRWGVLPNESFPVQGNNLFEGDITLTVSNRDKTYRPVLSEFAPDGTVFTVTLPTLAPGTYFVKTLQNGQEISCMKVNVLNDKSQPVLMGIGSYLQCMNFETMPLVREKQNFINYTPATSSMQTNPIRFDEQLQLTRVGNSAEKFGIPIVLYGRKGSDSPAYFIIPASVPMGVYQANLQIKDPKTGELSFSEIYERLIEVQ